MKVKWRTHEQLLITGMTVITIGILIVQYFSRPDFLLPQAGSVLLLYLSYVWLNSLVIQMDIKGTIQSGGRFLRIAGVLLQLLVLSYVLGPVINFISYYVGSHYKRFEGVPLTFGFHPQPLLNAFGGWNTAIVLVSLYLVYAVIREVTIYFLERPGPMQSYRILVSNRATAFAATLFGLPFLLAVFRLVNQSFYRYYFAMAPPAELLFLISYYGLFPTQDGKSPRDTGFIGKLLLCAIGLPLPFSLFLGDELSWGFIAAMVTAEILLVLPLSWFLYNGKKDTILQLRQFSGELAKRDADLGVLRAQINPHFLFNALNALYGTALREGSADTAAGIQQLGDMMRFMLHDNQLDRIPMQSELDYLKNYIALQRLRLQETDDLVISVDIDDKGCHFLIAPMLLIPFVENAFKHGIRLEQRSWISIGLNCLNGQLHFSVTNSAHAALANDTEKARSGIGLQNVKQRLELLYPGKHELRYGLQANEFVVNLTINTNP